MSSGKINVLVVEASRVTREMLVDLLQSDPGLNVVGAAKDGIEALAAVSLSQPDLVTMDMHLPGMDGFEATRRIMETHPVPIVIMSANSDAVDVAKSFRALEAGAVAAVERPETITGWHGVIAERLLETIKAMAGVKVVRRWPKARIGARRETAARLHLPQHVTSDADLVAIGASTGGPPVLRTLLTGLGPLFPVPVLIVQHISPGFVQGLVNWLNDTTGMPVRVARHGEYGKPGHAYLAPDGCHMTVNRFGQISCIASEPGNGPKPAVSALFRSVAENFGPRAVGVLLTGMGRDGADELKLMRNAGAVTIAQDKESSVVHGMPGEAIALNAARHVMPPDSMVSKLRSLVGKPLPAAMLRG
jgi:two-component system chemotaxis response regulator CheB